MFLLAGKSHCELRSDCTEINDCIFLCSENYKKNNALRTKNYKFLCSEGTLYFYFIFTYVISDNVLNFFRCWAKPNTAQCTNALC